VADNDVGRLFAALASADLPVPAAGSVVARGRQRRRRARGLAALAVVAVAAVIVAGIVGLPAIGRGSPTAPGRHASKPRHGSARAAGMMCPAAPDKAVSTALGRELAASTQHGIVPVALSASGRELFAVTTAGSFHGIVEESIRTAVVIARIEALAPGETAQGVPGPGGGLAFTVSHVTGGGQGPAVSTGAEFWAPDAKLTALEPPGQVGGVLSPLAVSGGRLAAWEQSDGKMQEIVEANLATGVADVISRGYVGPPVFVGGALVWPVAPNAASAFTYGRNPQAPSHLAAVHAATFPAGGPIAVPPALRAAGSATLIASDGLQTAYASPDLADLYYSPAPSQPARLVFRLPAGNAFTPGAMAFGTSYLAWQTASATSYLVSTRSLAVVAIPGFSSLAVIAADVIIENTTGPKLSPAIRLHLLTGPAITTLRCATPG
jgi:hypothetical protein